MSAAAVVGAETVTVVPRSAGPIAPPEAFVTVPEPHPEMATTAVAADATAVLSAGSASDRLDDVLPVIAAGAMANVPDASAGTGSMPSVPVADTDAAEFDTVSV